MVFLHISQLPYIFTVSVFTFLICAKLFTDDSNTAITITIFDNDFILKIFNLIRYTKIVRKLNSFRQDIPVANKPPF